MAALLAGLVKPTKLAFLFGCRRSEVFGMPRSEVRLEEGVIAVGSDRPKSKKLSRRMLPLTPEVRELLSPLPFQQKAFVYANEKGKRRDGDPAFNRAWRAAVALAELPEKRNSRGVVQTPDFHSLRHARATILRDQGLTYEQIAEAIGWDDRRMAKRYGSHREAERLATVFFPPNRPQDRPQENREGVSLSR